MAERVEVVFTALSAIRVRSQNRLIGIASVLHAGKPGRPDSSRAGTYDMRRATVGLTVFQCEVIC